MNSFDLLKSIDKHFQINKIKELIKTPEFSGNFIDLQKKAFKKGLIRIIDISRYYVNNELPDLKKINGRMRYWFDKISYCADEIIYCVAPLQRSGRGALIFPNPSIIKQIEKRKILIRGVLVDANKHHSSLPLIANGVYGDTRHPFIKKITDNKKYEIQFLEQIDRTLYPETFFFEGYKELVKKDLIFLLQKFSMNFFIKNSSAAATGVGGDGLIQRKDLVNFIKYFESSETEDNEIRKKNGMIKRFMKNPANHILQEDLKIKKDKITNRTIEYRIHTICNKIVKTLDIMRTNSIEGINRKNECIDWIKRRFLNKIPEAYLRIPFGMAIDIADTHKGFKIIELNAGNFASGFLDPIDFLCSGKDYSKKEELLKRLIYSKFLSCVILNSELYRMMTGRESKFGACLKVFQKKNNIFFDKINFFGLAGLISIFAEEFNSIKRKAEKFYFDRKGIILS